MIVDDEPKVRRGLAGLINAKPDKYCLLASCACAAQAGEFLSANVVDVVITDIKMPGMSGLELISHVRNRNPHVRFVILSGYGEFEYAREAIRFQVANFLLKPVNEAELYDALDCVADDLAAGQTGESYGDSYFYILVKTSSPQEQSECLSKIGLEADMGAYCVLVYAIEYMQVDAAADPVKFRTEVQAIFTRCLGRKVKVYHFFARQLVVVVPGKQPEVDRLLAAVHALMESFTCYTHVGISEAADSMELLRERYFQAVTASHYHLYDEYKRIFYYDTESMQRQIRRPAKTEDMLISSIQHGKKKELAEKVRELTDYYRNSGINIFRLKQQLLKFVENLSLLAERYGLDDSELKQLRQFVTDIEEIKSYKQMEEVFCNGLTALSNRIQHTVTEKSRSKIQDILEYLESNYHKNLSLNDVAEQAGISPTYLSNYFKIETGVNYIDYLTEIRIKAAKKLLSESRQKIYCIAQSLGYEDPKYFATLFKKQVGVTPGEFRRLFKK